MKLKGFVYLIKAKHKGYVVYKYGATKKSVISRITAAKRNKNFTDVELVMSIPSEDPFRSEWNIKWNLQSFSAASEWFISDFKNQSDLEARFRSLAENYPRR